jgi:NhaA family Na+:H+ antiporter
VIRSAATTKLRQAAATFVDNSGLLVAGTLIALIWANVDREAYIRAAHGLEFFINDIAMAFFFALAAKEVTEATAPGGVLHSPRRAGLPLMAAVGGMLGPALIFLGLTVWLDRPDLERGWAIPCATDIAFSYLAARRVFGAKHPAIPFLLLLAIADDALGLLIIAAFYPTGPLRPVDFGLLLGAAMVASWWLRRRGTLSFWPYLAAGGILSWIGFHRGGFHPALALVPIIPFLPHSARDPGLFVDSSSEHDTLNRFEHRLKRPVDIMLFFFGFANAGVTFGNAGAGTWLVLGAILCGKPVGILAATFLSTLVGLRLPKGVTHRDLIVVGMTAGIGFTVALFFATAAFPYGRLLEETKLGALLSCSAGLMAFIAARLLRVGRYAPHARSLHEAHLPAASRRRPI